MSRCCVHIWWLRMYDSKLRGEILQGKRRRSKILGSAMSPLNVGRMRQRNTARARGLVMGRPNSRVIRIDKRWRSMEAVEAQVCAGNLASPCMVVVGLGWSAVVGCPGYQLDSSGLQHSARLRGGKTLIERWRDVVLPIPLSRRGVSHRPVPMRPSEPGRSIIVAENRVALDVSQAPWPTTVAALFTSGAHSVMWTQNGVLKKLL